MTGGLCNRCLCSLASHAGVCRLSLHANPPSAMHQCIVNRKSTCHKVSTHCGNEILVQSGCICNSGHSVNLEAPMIEEYNILHSEASLSPPVYRDHCRLDHIPIQGFNTAFHKDHLSTEITIVRLSSGLCAQVILQLGNLVQLVEITI